MAKNHHTAEFNKMRGVVLWLYDEKCSICNRPNAFIVVHHCDNDSKNNCILNLVPLCPDHNKWAHLYTSKINVKPMRLILLLLKKVNDLLLLQ